MKHAVIGVLCLCAVAGAVAAQSPAEPVQSSAEQQALAPFQSLIARLPPALRERLFEHARAWVALTPEEQARLRGNLVAWNDMPPQGKLALRENFEAWEHMDAATRAAVLEAARGYAMLPESTRQGWRERFNALSPEQRQRYRFDPSTRSAMDLANALFPFIPTEQHDDTLTMLRNLSPEQVEMLRGALVRLPPAQRNAYRQRLLDMTADERMQALSATP